MRPFSISTTLLASVMVASAPSVIEASATSKISVQQQKAPHPPPGVEIHDPQSGPFIVRLNADGKINADQYAVIGNAVRMWSGENLQAFTICFRSQTGPVEYDISAKALTTVARELKARGAAIVVMPNGSMCESTYRPNWPGAYVEIMGVVRR